jgi:hypothetical protein
MAVPSVAAVDVGTTAPVIPPIGPLPAFSLPLWPCAHAEPDGSPEPVTVSPTAWQPGVEATVNPNAIAPGVVDLPGLGVGVDTDPDTVCSPPCDPMDPRQCGDVKCVIESGSVEPGQPAAPWTYVSCRGQTCFGPLSTQMFADPAGDLVYSLAFSPTASGCGL